MRVTNQYSFDTFNRDHSKVLGELNKLNAQISSGQKIQNSYDDSSVYTNILKFESQENELSSIKERSVQARVMADSTDSTLNDFTQTLRDFNTKLIGASNATMNSDNLESIATELEEMKKHMMSLSNTKVNGQYLFSGSNTNTKPIDNDGKYHGNGDALMTSVGDGVKIQRNIDGQSLFLGDDLNIHKTIETNVKLTNKIDKDVELTSESTIRDMVGDDDDIATNDNSVDFFISGTKRDGTAFKNIVNIDADKNIGDLLSKISDAYDGTVDVSLSDSGTIKIIDKQSGYSSIDFKMVGVQGTIPKNDLNVNPNDKIIPFISGNPLKIDQQNFTKDGATLEGNVSLVADGAFATAKTTFDAIAGASMNGKSFEMKLNDIHGNSQIVSLDLSANSTFKIGGTTYNIYNANRSNTTSEDFTMGQLNNIISMVTSGKLPASNSAQVFEQAIVDSSKIVDVQVNEKGHLQIHDNSKQISKIEFAMYDTEANDFSVANQNKPSISFMSNNAITTAEAHLSFFDEIDNVIASVRSGIVNLDSSSANPRNIGMNNSLNKLEQMNNHFNNAQAKIGVRSKSLEIAEQKASVLEVNVKQLKSETTEVDMAETIMKLNQTTLSYQAMLQTVTKVNSLSLLNYMK